MAYISFKGIYEYIKNKLYVSTNRGDDPEQRIAHYKAYRNKLHNLLKAAERQHYQDLLMVHKSNQTNENAVLHVLNLNIMDLSSKMEK